MADAAMQAFLGEGEIGPKTGLEDLDRVTGGLPLAQLTVLAGRTGMGKSAMGTCLGVNLAKQGIDVLLFSIEMTHVQLGQRMMCDLAYTNPDPVQYENTGHHKLSSLHHERLKASRERLAKLPIYTHDISGLKISDITNLSRRRAAELRNCGRKLGAVFVDHIGIMAPENGSRERRDRDIADITRGLSCLAKEFNIPVVALCQLNRKVEDRDNKRPLLPDLRDSGAIEEDASLVLMLYRPAYYLEQQKFDDPIAEAKRLQDIKKYRNKIEVSILKNRNGQMGRVDLFADMGANALRTLGHGYGDQE